MRKLLVLPLFLLTLATIGLVGLLPPANAQDGGAKENDAGTESKQPEPQPTVAPVDFETQILPLLHARCFECHSDAKPKPKGKLRLDGKNWILTGGKGGPVILAGNHEKSVLYRRAALYEEEDDVMPPDGNTFDPKQLRLIERWIDEGAEFGKWTGKGGIDAPAPVRVVTKPSAEDLFEVYNRLGKDLTPAPATAVKSARDAGARVSEVFPGSPLLRVEFVSESDKVEDASLKALSGLRNNVAILSLRNAGITDAAMLEIAALKNLMRLEIPETAITDAGLETLAKAKLAELAVLNLYGTRVTDKGLDYINYPTLNTIYLWDTKVTAAGAELLGKRLPGCEVNWKRELPPAEDEDASGKPGKRKNTKK